MADHLVSNLVSTVVKLYLVCGLIFLFSSCASYTGMSGVYYTDKQDAIVIEDKKGLIEVFGKAPLERLSVKQKRGKLRFKSVAKGRIPIIQYHSDRYRFKVLSDQDDVFKLSPTSRLSKAYFDNWDTIVFKSKYSFIDKNIQWDRIIYHSSRCYGMCPDFSIEIDKAGVIKLTNRGSGENGVNLNDNYIGKLTDTQMERLQRILSLSQLNTVKWAPRLCCDAPKSTIIIFFNQKCVRLHSMWTPVVSWDLVRFLSSQFKNSSLQKIDITFQYEP